MNNKKINFVFVLSLLLIILFSTSISAETGCFTYQESLYYCNDLSLEEAQIECSFFENCNLNNYFLESNSCENLELFPECQKILCKSTCQQEYLGTCESGAILEDNGVEWCSSGCCNFEFYAGEYCDFKENKGLCEVEAKNKNVELYNFDNSLDKNQCLSVCGDGNIEVVGQSSQVSEDVKIESKESQVIEEIQPNISENYEEKVTVSEIEKVAEQIEKTEKEGEEKSTIFVVLIGFFIFFLVFIFIYFLQKIRAKRSNKKTEKKEQKIEIKKPKRTFLNFFKSNKKSREHIQNIQHKREHRFKKRERKGLFAEFGLSAEKEDDEFHKLKKIISKSKKEKHQRHQHYQDIRKQKKLQEIKNLKKNKKKDIFSKLKEISKKKN